MSPTELKQDFNLEVKVSCKQIQRLSGCLYDTGSNSIPVRLHPGSMFIYMIQTKISFRKESFQNEICTHVPQVSCKGGTSSFRCGIRHVTWIGWADQLTHISAVDLTACTFIPELLE